MLIPARRFLAQKLPSCIRPIDLEPFVRRNQLSRRITAKIMHQGPNSMNFKIAVSETWDLRCQNEAKGPVEQDS
jgi:hypothetical protein